MKKLVVLLLLLPLFSSAQLRLCWEPIELPTHMSGTDGMLLNWTLSSGYLSDGMWVISDPGTHTIEVDVTDPNTGCTAHRAKTIRAYCDSCTFFVPNAFTPTNRDTINPTFFPVGENMQVETIRIWNRWGEMIYESNAPWDGKDQSSQSSQMDVYVWTCDYFCADKRKKAQGRVTVVR